MKVAFTIGAEAANARAVTIQLKRDRLMVRNVTSQRALEVYVSSYADGTNVALPIGYNLALTVGAAGELVSEPVTGRNTVLLVTDDDGRADLIFTDNGDGELDYYVNVIDPETGKVYTSPVLDFVDNTP